MGLLNLMVWFFLKIFRNVIVQYAIAIYRYGSCTLFVHFFFFFGKKGIFVSMLYILGKIRFVDFAHMGGVC